jgi:surface protein
MFDGCCSFNTDLSRWNVGNASNLSSMFDGFTSFSSDVLQWDVANAIEPMALKGMLAGCVSLNRDVVATWPLRDEQHRLCMFVGSY